MHALRGIKLTLSVLVTAAAIGYSVGPVRAQQKEELDLELLTWQELKKAIHEQGKTTALVFNGGTEQRGPQGVTGAHTFVAKAVGLEIAHKLGNAILAPVLPFSINRASSALPGTIGLSSEAFAAVNQEVAEQLLTNGFTNVVLLGDHGGGQRELKDVAERLNTKYAAQGKHVVYCADVYRKAGSEFNKWLTAHNLPVGQHASIKDTSELLYLEGNRAWIRKEQLPTAVGNGGGGEEGGNGISGDARKSSPEIGKVISGMKVDFAVEEIRKLLAEKPAK